MSTVAPTRRTAPPAAGVVLPAPRRPHEAKDASPAAPLAPAPPAGPRRRAPRRATSNAPLLMLTAALVVALGLAAHLWMTANAWQDRAAAAAAAQQSQATATTTALQQRVGALQGDLDASDARIEQLAAEKARAADLAAASAQRPVGSTRSATSGASAEELTRSTACAVSQRALLDALLADSTAGGADGTDAAVAQRLAVSADEDCAGVIGVRTGSDLADALP